MFCKLITRASALLIGLSWSSSSAAVLYQETFPAAVNNTAVGTIDWFSYKGDTAVDRSAPPQSSNSTIAMSAGSGVDTLNNVGSGGPAGLIFGNVGAGTTTYLLGTGEAGPVAQSSVGSITFWMRGFTSGGGRVAVRIDSNDTPEDNADDLWFATSNLFAEAGSTFVQQSFSFTTIASVWRDISFTPEVQLALAETARTESLPTGSITGFGMFFDISAGGIRLDDYTVHSPSVVPIPGDFNSDGNVDGEDFSAWQMHFPTSSGADLADGDGDADGDVDGADFVIWQTNYLPASEATTPIPEPQSIVLCGLAAMWFIAFLGRKRI
jgi:hypothetical protein